MKKQIIQIPTQRRVKVILTIQGGKKFVGVATCLPTDHFQLGFGIDLATRKAEVKMYTYFVKQAKKEMEVKELEYQQSLRASVIADNKFANTLETLERLSESLEELTMRS